jgi:hypothetical protein
MVIGVSVFVMIVTFLMLNLMVAVAIDTFLLLEGGGAYRSCCLQMEQFSIVFVIFLFSRH